MTKKSASLQATSAEPVSAQGLFMNMSISWKGLARVIIISDTFTKPFREDPQRIIEDAPSKSVLYVATPTKTCLSVHRNILGMPLEFHSLKVTLDGSPFCTKDYCLI